MAKESGRQFEVMCCGCSSDNIGCRSCEGFQFKLKGPPVEPPRGRGDAEASLAACEECGAVNDRACNACQICGHLSVGALQAENARLRQRLHAREAGSLELQRALAEKSAHLQRLQMHLAVMEESYTRGATQHLLPPRGEQASSKSKGEQASSKSKGEQASSKSKGESAAWPAMLGPFAS